MCAEELEKTMDFDEFQKHPLVSLLLEAQGVFFVRIWTESQL